MSKQCMTTKLIGEVKTALNNFKVSSFVVRVAGLRAGFRSSLDEIFGAWTGESISADLLGWWWCGGRGAGKIGREDTLKPGGESIGGWKPADIWGQQGWGEASSSWAQSPSIPASLWSCWIVILGLRSGLSQRNSFFLWPLGPSAGDKDILGPGRSNATSCAGSSSNGSSLSFTEAKIRK